MTENLTEGESFQPPALSDAQFGALAARYFDGRVTEHELAQLSDGLIRDAAQRRRFVQMSLFAGVVAEWPPTELVARRTAPPSAPALSMIEFADPDSPSPMPVAALLQAPSRRGGPWFGSDVLTSWLFAALVIFSALASAWFWRLPASNPVAREDNAAAAPSETFAWITDTVNCRWADPAQAPDFSRGLESGQRLDLLAGRVELLFDSGASIVLEGPVSAEITGRNGLTLGLGKLTARVENLGARGFAVRTLGLEIVDLGTEFGVEVEQAGATLVHVFDGRVELHTRSGQALADAISLDAQQAMRFDPRDGRLARVEFQPERFVRQLRAPVVPGQEVLVNLDYNSTNNGADGATYAGAAAFGSAGDFWNGHMVNDPRTRAIWTPPLLAADGLTATGIRVGVIEISSAYAQPTAAATDAIDLMTDYVGLNVERLPRGGGPATIVVAGLAPGSEYDLVLYGGVLPRHRSTFQIASRTQTTDPPSQSGPLASPAYYVTFEDVPANKIGRIEITWSRVEGNLYASLNGLQIRGPAGAPEL